MANTWTALMHHTRSMPNVHDTCPALVDQFGPAEPAIRQIGSALGVIAMDERIAAFLEDNDPMALEQVRAAFRRYVELATSYEFIKPNPFENRTEKGIPLVVIGHRLALLRDLLPFSAVSWHSGRIHQESDGRSRTVLAAVAQGEDYFVVVVGSYGDTEQDPDDVSVTVLTGPEAAQFAANPKWGGGFWSSSLLWEHNLLRTHWSNER